ncbi:hypothetical protein VFPBJ_08983 [Purpureocillium lilacinum]|uniref:Uncharacterized protein n=1 Tax=Purpureocillium lilacinum TaxID=33203 RepID=A0A179GGZ4_PURLI|nr:hypothetical protein VFPBJ_08983 [Purpureocillium lilacinum]
MVGRITGARLRSASTASSVRSISADWNTSNATKERVYTREAICVCNLPLSVYKKVSDLLIRHGRLSHNKSSTGRDLPPSESPLDSGPFSEPVLATTAASPTADFQPPPMGVNDAAVHTLDGQSQECRMDVLPVDAREDDCHGAFTGDTRHGSAALAGISVESGSSENAQPAPVSQLTPSVIDPDLLPEPDETDMDFYTFNSFANFLETAPLPSFYFSSLLTTEQPLPFFSPPDCGEARDELDIGRQAIAHERHEGIIEEPDSFSRLGSRLPSLQPEEPRTQSRTVFETALGLVEWRQTATAAGRLGVRCCVTGLSTSNTPDTSALRARLHRRLPRAPAIPPHSLNERYNMFR